MVKSDSHAQNSSQMEGVIDSSHIAHYAQIHAHLLITPLVAEMHELMGHNDVLLESLKSLGGLG